HRRPELTAHLLFGDVDSRAERIKPLQSWCRECDDPRSPVRRIRHSLDKAEGSALVYQFAHRLLAHRRTLSKLCEPRSLHVEIAGQVDMRDARLSMSSLAHQCEDAGFKPANGVIQDPSDIAVSPGRSLLHPFPQAS